MIYKKINGQLVSMTTGGGSEASDVYYDTSTTPINSDNVQDAIHEMDFYAVCSTAAITSAKQVTGNSYPFPSTDSIQDGSVIRIKFTNGNTAANPTLTISASDDNAFTYPIKYMKDGSIASPKVWWSGGEIVTFVYHADIATNCWLMMPTQSMIEALNAEYSTIQVNPASAPSEPGSIWITT